MTPAPPSPQQPVQPDERSHVEKHGLKYVVGILLAAIVQLLNFTGQLAPIMCQFAKDPALCIAIGKAAGDTSIVLDKTVITSDTVIGPALDGGQ